MELPWLSISARAPGRFLYFIFHSLEATDDSGPCSLLLAFQLSRLPGARGAGSRWKPKAENRGNARCAWYTVPLIRPFRACPVFFTSNLALVQSHTMLALLLLPAERFARSPCAAAFPRRALLRCSATEEPAAGALSRAQNLESLLSLAVQTERYEEAARLRDELASLGVDTELAVLQANNQFYRSFSDADLQVRAVAHAHAQGTHALLALCARSVHTRAPRPSSRPDGPLCVYMQCVRSVRALSLRASLAGDGRGEGLHRLGLQPPVAMVAGDGRAVGSRGRGHVHAPGSRSAQREGGHHGLVAVHPRRGCGG